MSIFDRFKESAGAGATILGFVGIIGSVAVYGTNLKNQFDASQTKIVQLETQVATLRDQLDKSYSATSETVRGPKGDKGDRGERGERGPVGERGHDADETRTAELEKRVSELAAMVANAGSSATHQSTAVNLVTPTASISDFSRQISDRGFEGVTSDGANEWPFVVSQVRFTDETHFVGQLEWMSLNAIHRIEGTLFKGVLWFKETKKIKRGNAITGCEYSIPDTVGSSLDGTYTGCASGGTIHITLK